MAIGRGHGVVVVVVVVVKPPEKCHHNRTTRKEAEMYLRAVFIIIILIYHPVCIQIDQFHTKFVVLARASSSFPHPNDCLNLTHHSFALKVK